MLFEYVCVLVWLWMWLDCTECQSHNYYFKNNSVLRACASVYFSICRFAVFWGGLNTWLHVGYWKNRRVCFTVSAHKFVDMFGSRDMLERLQASLCSVILRILLLGTAQMYCIIQQGRTQADTQTDTHILWNMLLPSVTHVRSK